MAELVAVAILWLVATFTAREVEYGLARSSWFIGHSYPYMPLRAHWWNHD